MIKSSILLFLFTFTSILVFSQKEQGFTGMLEYKITVRDTSLRALIPENKMVVYTNDTISRVENYTSQLGKQVVIRHMALDKKYILINAPMGNFAIKVNESKIDTLETASKYDVKKKCFKRKVLGKKVKRLQVSHKAFEEPIEFLYFKNISNKYLNNIDNIPGLLAKFSLVTPDAVMDYELVKILEYAPDRDLFGIPSDYKRVTIDEFIDIMTGVPEESPEDN